MYLPKPPQSPLGFCSILQGSLLASTLNAWKFILCNIQGYLFNTEVPSHHSLTWVVPNGFSLLLDKTCTPDKCLQPCLPAPYLTPYNPHTPAFSPVFLRNTQVISYSSSCWFTLSAWTLFPPDLHKVHTIVQTSVQMVISERHSQHFYRKAALLSCQWLYPLPSLYSPSQDASLSEISSLSTTNLLALSRSTRWAPFWSRLLSFHCTEI